MTADDARADALAASRAVPSDDDTALMRQAARTLRLAEHHWPADMLMQAADTIDRLRDDADSLAAARAVPADHTATTEDAHLLIHKAQKQAAQHGTYLSSRDLAQALAAAGLLATARPDTTEAQAQALETAADAADKTLTTQDRVGRLMATADWLRERAGAIREGADQ